MAETLEGFYEPKVYTAAEAIAAGKVVKIKTSGEILKTTAGNEAVAGFTLTAAAASGDKVTVVHGGWLVTAGLTAGDALMPAADGALATWASTGQKCGFARSATSAFIY